MYRHELYQHTYPCAYRLVSLYICIHVIYLQQRLDPCSTSHQIDVGCINTYISMPIDWDPHIYPYTSFLAFGTLSFFRLVYSKMPQQLRLLCAALQPRRLVYLNTAIWQLLQGVSQDTTYQLRRLVCFNTNIWRCQWKRDDSYWKVL